jgi:hypothetical protein
MKQLCTLREKVFHTTLPISRPLPGLSSSLSSILDGLEAAITGLIAAVLTDSALSCSGSGSVICHSHCL